MESEKNKVEFTVESDAWHTIWLIKKALYESEKRESSVRIEVKSGSVESVISLIADAIKIGGFAFAIIEYIRKKRQQERPVKITRFDRDVAYEYVKYHLRTVADVAQPSLVEERPIPDGGQFFKFKDPFGNFHTYKISKTFEVEYKKSR